MINRYGGALPQHSSKGALRASRLDGDRLASGSAVFVATPALDSLQA
jgi:hypothetical protein